MKAVLCKQWGTPDTLVFGEAPDPLPGPGQVRIGVQASGLNFADIVMIAGKYQDRPPFPFSPGFELAGEILEIGPGVDHLKAGDRVAAWCDYGGYAEEAVVPAASVLPIPEAMDYASAAAFTIAYGTSHLALERRARLKEGEVLLVHGAAGGVGLTAVEIGKLMGATVIASAGSASKLDLARRYGADHAINHSSEDFVARVRELTGGRGADVIYDPVGGDVFDQSLRCLNNDGRLLVIGFASGRIPKVPVNLTLLKNISIVGAYWGGYAWGQPEVVLDSLETLLRLYEEGRIRPYVSKTYPLEQASLALNTLLERESTGRVVLTTHGDQSGNDLTQALQERRPVHLSTMEGKGQLPAADLDDSAALLDLMESGRDD
jgi:NADPH2:quinone reductase